MNRGSPPEDGVASGVRHAAPRFRARLLAPRYWPSWLAAGLLALVCLLPRAATDRLADRIGDFNYRRKYRRRETARINLEICFPELTPEAREALLRQHFRAFTRSLLDLPRLWIGPLQRATARHCHIRGMEHLHAARTRGRSVIILSPHTVSVDIGGTALSMHLPMCTLVKLTGHPLADWLLNRARARTGGWIFAREDGLRPVLRALRAGRLLYYMPDEDLGTRDSVFAPFFGHPKATLATLGRLARSADSQVVPMMSWYAPEKQRYEVELLPALADFPSGDATADATAMNRALEDAIRLRPEAYMWTFRLFLTQPGRTASPYPGKRRRG